MRWLVSLFAMVACVSALAQTPPAVNFKVERFQIDGDNPLDPKTTETTLAPFLGDYSGIDGLLGAKDALEQAFAKAGYNFARVSLPAQALDSGIVILKVTSVSVGELQIKGNEHFTEDNIRRSLPKLRAAGGSDLSEVSRSLAVANEHPHKKLRVTFKESELQPDMVDAVVNVQDRRPWNLFATINNIGTQDTGRSRLQLGGMYGNLSGHDDVFSTAVTISPDNINNVMQFGAFYQIPIYQLSGWLSGFYVKSDVDVGNVQNVFDVSGAGDFYGISFKRQLIGVGRYKHSLTAGLQDRSFDTSIFNAATGLPIRGISTIVRSRPFTARYDGGYNWVATSFDFYVDFTTNLSFGGHNNDFDYSKVRKPAVSDWKVMRFGALVTQQLPEGFSGVFRLNGQYSREPLIPGEQFGVGGERSVRGFDERTIAGDTALVANLELWTPPVEQLDGVRFLGFLDAGHKHLVDPLAKQLGSDTISSIGIGARYQWRDQVGLSADYGLPLAHAGGEAAHRGTSKWHLTLQVRY